MRAPTLSASTIKPPHHSKSSNRQYRAEKHLQEINILYAKYDTPLGCILARMRIVL